MLGQMMQLPLLISSLIVHAERHHGEQEVVSRRVEGDIHRETYKQLAARARQMAKALAAGRVPRRAMFGFLDADGWGWAGVKAAVWLVIIILLLGYIPDRAYYFTVGKTIDLGIMFWSPVNIRFCELSDVEPISITRIFST